MPRTLLISGASRGIGQSIAAEALAVGHRVIGLGRRFDDETFAQQSGFLSETVDLSDLKTLPERLKALVKRYPDVDGLILNAGRGQFGSLEEFSYAQIESLMALNFTAQAFIVRAFLPQLKRSDRSDIIFIGSEAALWGGRRGAVYSASKAALRGFAQALREECARSGVRICVINPGLVRTGFFDGLAFQPGSDAAHAIEPQTVAMVALHVLKAPPETVFDEINVSPLKKVLQFRHE